MTRKASHARRRPGKVGARLFSELKADHARFGRVLALIGRHAPTLATERNAELVALLGEAVDYIANFQNTYHHPREERMFERMAKRSSEYAKILSDLRKDHEESSRAGQRLLALLNSVSKDPGDVVRLERLALSLESFARAMRLHIHREEELMYSRAPEMLDENDWRVIARGSPTPRDPLGQRHDARGQRFRALARYVAEGEERVLVSTRSSSSTSRIVDVAIRWIEQSVQCSRLVWRQAKQARELGFATLAAFAPQAPAAWWAAVRDALNSEVDSSLRWMGEWRKQLGGDGTRTTFEAESTTPKSRASE